MNEDDTVQKQEPGDAENALAAVTRAPAKPAANAAADSSYQNYLFGGSGTDGAPAWSDSTKGRAAIRLISRGLVGTAFFTLGGRFARNQLHDYEPHDWNKARPLQWLAKGIDVTFGRLIGKGAWLAADVRKAANAGEKLLIRDAARWNATRFRSKAYYHSADGLLQTGFDGALHPMNGRSLGAEMVGVTFDFAMASIGDASTRNIIQAFDPNIKKSWLLNDQGAPAARGEKTHIDWGKWAKAVGKTSWRIFAKNQGEDWAAALPYVYQMRAQRQMLTNIWDRRFSGAKLVFDQAWSGGALKVNNHGQVVGDYQLPGAMDLHARFVGYNWYTLMYREGYDAVGRAFTRWKENGFAITPHLPQHFNPITDTAEGIASTLRYVTKSFIKANLYMNTAVIPFWIMRASSSKWKGGLINHELPEGVNAIGAKIPHSEQVRDAMQNRARYGLPNVTEAEMHALMHQQNALHGTVHNYSSKRNMTFPTNKTSETIYYGDTPVRNPMQDYKNPYDWKMYEHYKTDTAMDKFEKGFSMALNPFGWVSYKVGRGAAKLSGHFPEPIKNFLGQKEPRDYSRAVPKTSDASREAFMQDFVGASMSYTPYMFAKAETGLRVDDTPGNGELGNMDRAIYGFMDNLGAFKLGAAWQSAKEIGKLATHFEKQVKSREGEEIKPAGDGAVIANSDKQPPSTHVQTASSAHAMMQEAPQHNRRAEDKEHSAERQWAESVVGRELGGQFQAASPTRH